MGNKWFKKKVNMAHYPPAYDPPTPTFNGPIEPFANLDDINASDILRVALKFLSFRSAARVSLVCKDFNTIVRDSEDYWENILAHLFLYHDVEVKPLLQLAYDADKSVTDQTRYIRVNSTTPYSSYYRISRELFQYQSLQKYKTARETFIAFAKYVKVIQAYWVKVALWCEEARERPVKYSADNAFCKYKIKILID